MSKRNISNYALAILLTFAITSFGLTYFVFPSYAAPTLTTFFSCETSDGCGYRYNTTLYLAPLPNNMTQIGNWTTNALIYQMGSNETIVINGSSIERASPFPILDILHKPSVNGTTALHIFTDINNVGESKSLEIEVNASTLIAGRTASIFSVVINKGVSTGGFIHAYSATVIGSGSATVEGLGVFSGIIPIHQHAGAPANMDRALLYTGSFSDVTAAFTSTGNDTSIFVSNDDSVYIGHASQFSEMQFALGTHASGAGVNPSFEFSTGAGGWTMFSPLDGTDGMRSDGSIAIEPNDLTGWAVDTVSGFNNLFWVRINRTQVGLGTVPIENLVQIVVGTEYIWDANGNLQILGMNVTDNLIVTGTSDFNGIVDGNNNAFNNLGAAGNDLGTINALVTSIITGNLTVTRGVAGAVIFVIEQPTVVGWRNGMTSGSNILKWDASNDALPSPEMQLTTSGGLTVSGGFFSNGPSDFSNNLLSNVGAAGNDLGNPNAFVASQFSGSVSIVTNNTLSLFTDAVRIADAYFVVSHVKTQVTDLQLEAEYKPNPFEVFNNGDVVCSKEWKIFTKCSVTYNKILGPIYLLRERSLTGYENETKLENNKEVIYTKEIWDIIGYNPVIVVEGPYIVKVCSPILEGQLLIAGNNGCVDGVNSYSDIQDLMFPIGYADSNSKGDYVDAIIL